MLNDYRITPKGKISSAIILLHGVGANGEDLLGVAELLKDRFPHTVFIAPDAPEPYDMAPFGRQWFSLSDRNPHAMQAGISRSDPILKNYIAARLDEFALPANQALLMGFSQGTMMSLYTGLRLDTPLAGILGYSGALFGGDDLQAPASAPSLCLIHGKADDVVPAMASQHGASLLQNAGYPTELHLLENLGHSINQEGLMIGAAFLQRHIMRPANQP